MRHAIAAALSLVLLAFPATAQDAVDPADIGPNVARDFWCASAFGVASANAAEAGDGVGSISLRESMTTLFQRLLLEMQAGGYSREQYDDLAADSLRRVLDPFRSASDGFTRDACENAVTEATAFLEEVPEPTAP
jgi:hypothetical protein